MSYHPFEEIEKMTIETPNDQELGKKVRTFINACAIMKKICEKQVEEIFNNEFKLQQL